MRFSILVYLAVIIVISSCSKEPNCRCELAYPCMESRVSASSSIEGHYGGDEVCIYYGVKTYDSNTRIRTYSTSNPDGSNLVHGSYAASISFQSTKEAYTAPDLRLMGPQLEFEPESKLTYNERLHERLQNLNSNKVWKVGSERENIDGDNLSLHVSFPCPDTFVPNSGGLIHRELFHTRDDQLDSDDYIKIQKFEAIENGDDINYDIILEIKSSMYYANCLRDCEDKKLKVIWSTSFSLPKI